VRHHRFVAYSVELVLLNKHHTYGGAPKVNCYPVYKVRNTYFSQFKQRVAVMLCYPPPR